MSSKDESLMMNEILKLVVETKESSVRSEEKLESMNTSVENLNKELVEVKLLIDGGFEDRDKKIATLRTKTNLLTVGVIVSMVLLLVVMGAIFDGFAEFAKAVFDLVRGT